MSELDDWAASVVGRYIDVDQNFGNQCWDLSQHWLTHIAGSDATLWTQPSSWPGLAAGCWEVANSDAWPGPTMRGYLTPIPGDQPGQPGDVIIWQHGARLYPISHTAVLMADQGANLDTVSQNSSAGQPWLPGYSPLTTGPAIRQSLPREGIAGFLRPNVISGMADSITTITEGFLMALTDKQQADIYWILCEPDGREALKKLVSGDKTDAIYENVVGTQQGAYADVIAKHSADKVLNAPIPVAGEAKPRNTSLALESSWNAANFRNIPAGVWNQNIGALGNAAGVLANIDAKPAAAPAAVDIDALATSIAAHLTTNQAHQFIVALGQALPKE